jgi:hypothetical protein
MRPKVRAVLDVSSTLVVSVVAIAMLIIFLQDRNMAESPWGSNTEPVEDWRAWSVSGIRVGPEEAEIVVTVFTDFQCPFCGSLVPILDSLASAFPDRLVSVPKSSCFGDFGKRGKGGRSVDRSDIDDGTMRQSPCSGI